MSQEITFLFISLGLFFIFAREILNGFIVFSTSLAKVMRAFSFEQEELSSVADLSSPGDMTKEAFRQAVIKQKTISNAQKEAETRVLKSFTCNVNIFIFLCLIPLANHISTMSSEPMGSTLNAVWILVLASFYIYICYFAWSFFNPKDTPTKRGLPVYSRYKLLIYLAVFLAGFYALSSPASIAEIILVAIGSVCFIFLSTCVYRIPHIDALRNNEERGRAQISFYNEDVGKEALIYITVYLICYTSHIYFADKLDVSKVGIWVSVNAKWVISSILMLPFIRVICVFIKQVKWKSIKRYLTYTPSDKPEKI